jgi:hypothetical protein
MSWTGLDDGVVESVASGGADYSGLVRVGNRENKMAGRPSHP